MTDFDYSFFDSAYHGDVQRMRGSLERGHDVNALAPLWKSVYQPTALAYAVWGNQPEAVHFLLEHGADPNHSDGVRPTPHHARATASGRMQTFFAHSVPHRMFSGPELPSFALGVVQERSRRVRSAPRRRRRRSECNDSSWLHPSPVGPWAELQRILQARRSGGARGGGTPSKAAVAAGQWRSPASTCRRRAANGTSGPRARGTRGAHANCGGRRHRGSRIASRRDRQPASSTGRPPPLDPGSALHRASPIRRCRNEHASGPATDNS